MFVGGRKKEEEGGHLLLQMHDAGSAGRFHGNFFRGNALCWCAAGSSSDVVAEVKWSATSLFL